MGVDRLADVEFEKVVRQYGVYDEWDWPSWPSHVVVIRTFSLQGPVAHLHAGRVELRLLKPILLVSALRVLCSSTGRNIPPFSMS